MAYPTSLDSFTTKIDNTDDVLSAHINATQTAIESIEAKLGIDSSAVATSIDYLLKSASSTDPGHLHSKLEYLAAAGNKVWSYANTAWTGWTIVAVTDSVLAVKGGSNAYNVTGGQTAGTWTQPSHTLTYAEIPAHTHGISYEASGVGVYKNPIGATGTTQTDTDAIQSTGGSSSPGGGAHSHGTTYRPLAAVGVIISKDA